jgi:hypothetical protein
MRHNSSYEAIAGGRPVTARVTPVNMGNQPHCDNGEGVATASPLPSTDFIRRRLSDGGVATRRYRVTVLTSSDAA